MSGFQPSEPNGLRFAASTTKASQQLSSSNGTGSHASYRDQQQLASMDSYSKLSSMTPSYLANANAADENGLIRNPLFCLMCNQTYQNPCLLSCYHTFCAVCLKGRAKDGKIACPLCGKVTPLRDGHNLPPADHLLRFLVESTCEDFPSCANCDRNAKSPMFFCNTCVCWSSQKDCDHFLSLINKETGLVIGDVTQLPMFYCNTCGQALCGPCRDDTHRAKMFSQHEVIHMSKKTKEMHKKCLFHGEPFTMFCTSKKTMLCIKCFRDTSAEDRLHCVDLDTAYNQGAKKLERSLASIRELQSSLRDGVILFRALLDELRRNMEIERDCVNTTYSMLQEAIQKQYDVLIKDLESQYTSKDVELKEQLHSIGTMLPTVQIHSILCTTFSSTANKHEFLNMAYQLIDRLTTLAHLTYPLRPASSTEINTHYKASFAQCLEPITATLNTSTTANAVVNAKTGGLKSSIHHHGNTYPPKRSSVESASCLNLTTASGASLSRLRSMPQDAIKKQTLSARGLSDKEFTKHCRGFEGQIKDLNGQFNSIRKQVSDLHRDVTTRRCLTSYKKVENIVLECTTLTDQLEKTDQLMQERKSLFNRMWEEEQQRITTEQAIFKEQLSELGSLRTDLKQLMGIARQLEPYIRSITTVMERIQPEVRSTSTVPMYEHPDDAPTMFDPELVHAEVASKSQASSSKRQHHQQQQQQQQQQAGSGKPSVNYPITSGARTLPSSGGRQPDFERLHPDMVEHIQQMAASSMHAAKVQQECQAASSPPSDAPTPLPPPMASMVSSSSPCARGSPYDRQTLHRPSSREGMLGHSKQRGTQANLEEVPVRDTLPTSMWCSTVETSSGPQVLLPPQPPMQQGLKPSSYYSSSQFSEKSSQQLSHNGADFPLAEPPLEYLTPAEAELPRKNLSENAADVKRGILSSLLEKVKSKEEAAAAIVTAAAQKHLRPSPSLAAAAPLASTESLTPSESTTGSSTIKRLSSSVTGESVSTVVHKPYEPPAIGKSSRVTPVGLDEEPERLSADSRVDNDSVEVVSLIRFNKSKLGSCSTTTSEKPSGSSSDTNSLAAAALAASSAFHHSNSSCPACDMAAAVASAASSRLRARSHSATSSTHSTTRRHEEEEEDEYDYYFERRGGASSVATTSTARRSSAPEIDEKDASRLSPTASSLALSSRTSGQYSSRSLERPKSQAASQHPNPHHHHRRPYTTSSLGRRSSASGRGDVTTEASSSDSESVRHHAPRRGGGGAGPPVPPPLSSRYSVGSVDQRDLQRAVAHLQEALQEHMQHRVKAVVHRGAEAVGAGAQGQSKTLDADIIKHHESIKRNAFESTAKTSKQQPPPPPSSAPTGSPMSTLGPYDTIKPSRMRRGTNNNNNNNHSNLPRQGSGDNLLQLQRRSEMKQLPTVTLRKADSFEGHEEAVRSLVEAVHESRKFEATRSKTKSASDN